MERLPQVRIGEWFNEAWRIVRPVWLECVLAILVYHLLMYLSTMCCVIPSLIVGGPLTGGVYVYLAKRLLGRPAEVSDLFKGFLRFGHTTLLFIIIYMIPILVIGLAFSSLLLPAMGIKILPEEVTGLLGLGGCFTICIGLIFVLIYPILVGTFLVFAYPLVLFRGMKATEAIRTSIALVRPKFFSFLIFLMAGALLILAAQSIGTLLFIIGALVLGPLAIAVFFTMQLLAYRDFVGLTEQDLALYTG